jgi:hypothetical protein
LESPHEFVQQPGVKRSWYYNRADINGLNNDIMNYNWGTIININDVHNAAKSFGQKLFSIFELHIPHRDRVFKAKDKPWFNVKLRAAINKRDKLYKMFIKSNTNENQTCFKTQAHIVSGLLNEAKERYKNNLLESLILSKSGSKNYCFFIKKLMGAKFSPSIPSLEHNGGTAISDGDKASLLLGKFLSKFHHQHDETVLPNCPPKTNSTLREIAVNRETVRNLLLSLDVSKSGGDDGIINTMLKLAAHSIDAPLTTLFHRLINTNTFPDCWKQGIIVPVFKNKGSTHSISNYRPVSLLNTLYQKFVNVLFIVVFLTTFFGTIYSTITNQGL